eukprot:TRINITY_DN66572_c0_g1_i1.p1 TRINITY_DN66572_c0_g1~~TRINITY_DN66572_c0_g1_i1.p1  ORF type:complete len:306 (+),score=62.31 TRINITY_DN66572_c0_g1_i1:86-1003(+)
MITMGGLRTAALLFLMQGTAALLNLRGLPGKADSADQADPPAIADDAIRIADADDQAAPVRDLGACPAPRSLPLVSAERSCNVCPAGPQLWSIPAQPDFRMTNIWFRNNLTEPIQLNFVGVDGIEYPCGALQPGQRGGFLSQEGHVTRAYAPDGRLLIEHMAGRRALGGENEVDVRRLAAGDMLAATTAQGMNANAAQVEAFKPAEDFEPAHPDVVKNYGFSNMLSDVLHLFFRDNTGEEKKVYELKPGEHFYQYSVLGHEWVARTKDGHLVSEFSVADVVINDCVHKVLAAGGEGADASQIAVV